MQQTKNKITREEQITSLQDELKKLGEVSERYSKIKGEVEKLEDSLPTQDVIKKQQEQMEREALDASNQELLKKLAEVTDSLKRFKGEVSVASEELRINSRKVKENIEKKKKNPWKMAASTELVLMLLLAVACVILAFPRNQRAVETNEISSGSQSGNAEQTGEPEKKTTLCYVENLSEVVSRMDRTQIAPFQVAVEKINGMEHLVYSYNKIRICYANEFEPVTDEAGNVILPDKTIRIENGARQVVYPWKYDMNSDLTALAPKYGAYAGAMGNQLLFFVGAEKGGMPSEVCMIDADALWEYERFYPMEQLKNQFNLSYAQEAGANGIVEKTYLDMNVNSASYRYEIGNNSYISATYYEEFILDFSEDFSWDFAEDTIRFSTVVMTTSREYLGEISGEVAIVGREMVLKNVRYGAYVTAYQEDSTGDGVIVPRECRMQEHITISGSNKQRYYIALSDDIARVDYNMSHLVKNEQGYFEYFDENGKKISRTGVDVSKYQGDIDWQKVKEAGIEFAILRLGYRGMNEGTLELDPYFRRNMEAAKEVGIPVGVYFFSQAITVEEAVEEAQMVLREIKGQNITYPVIFDTEHVPTYNARANNLPRDLRTDIAIAFCETIQEAGYRPMLYANTRWMILGVDLERLTMYDKWYAYYGDTFTFPYQYQMLQYTDKGSVPGISGNVDLDISFVDYSKEND